ncbi:MAG: OmpH family outer membrane protein [Vicinamibacteria bacterium]
MNLRKVAGAAAWVTVVCGLLAATMVFGQTPTPGATITTKIAVIDIERIAAESNAGKQLFANLKADNDKIQEEVARREGEIRDMQTKLNSEILSQDAKVRLQRDIERKRTDAQRWLQDAQAEFETKRQDGEAKFQESLEPIVRQVATENGIGLIIRATPGLTFVLDPALDISQLVVQKLDASAPPTGAAAPPPKQ